ncbi:unnamed protein product [Colias eurytheme]|nr:unnamed protein product [Colias eurytheme]
MMLAGAEIVENQSVIYKADGERAEALERSSLSAPSIPSRASASYKAPSPSQELQAQGLSRVPNRDPVDIQFSNITCTVSLGINKGEFSLLHKLRVLIVDSR